MCFEDTGFCYIILKNGDILFSLFRFKLEKSVRISMILSYISVTFFHFSLLTNSPAAMVVSAPSPGSSFEKEGRLLTRVLAILHYKKTTAFPPYRVTKYSTHFLVIASAEFHYYQNSVFVYVPQPLNSSSYYFVFYPEFIINSDLYSLSWA